MQEKHFLHEYFPPLYTPFLFSVTLNLYLKNYNFIIATQVKSIKRNHLMLMTIIVKGTDLSYSFSHFSVKAFKVYTEILS